MIYPLRFPPSDLNVEKSFLPDVRPADAGMRCRYPIEKASWIWHPELSRNTPAFLHFKCEFHTQSVGTLPLHFSCDQFAEVYVDGQLIARGPEASAKEAYSFSSFNIHDLPAGEHCVEVFAWWLGTGRLAAPLARETRGPGFLFASEGKWEKFLNSGTGDWQVAVIEGVKMDTERAFPASFGIGGGVYVDGRLSNLPRKFIKAKVLGNPPGAFTWGVVEPLYQLRPARLPEQKCEIFHEGRVRALVPSFVNANGYENELYTFKVEDEAHPGIADWQKAWSEQSALEIPAQTEWSCLIDLEEYVCGFPEWTLSGGRDAEVVWDWAESLFTLENGQEIKGNRNDIRGKMFRGLSDTFIADGSENSVLRPHWWRAGRYILLRIRTGDRALTLERFQILETGYPLEVSGEFICDQDEKLDPVKAICLRGLKMCMHETYMDCPHYEQLMYVFDTRLEILTTYALSGDDRLPRRAIELYDVSRSRFSGLACSRFPSMEDQLIPIFSLCWTWMVRDFLYWRDDPAWARQFLPGVRSVHDAFETFEDEEGLLKNLPGWMYGDWVKKWEAGSIPEGGDGISVIMNLVYVHSLLQLADVETHLGSGLRAQAARTKAQSLQQKIRNRFWNSGLGVFQDTREGDCFSQHAQIWAILSGTLKGQAAEKALETSLTDDRFSPVSFMLRSHLFDALAALGQGGRILEELWPWQEMLNKGAKTGFEHDEPTRSDCHAWSSHPLYHLPASVMGIRPSVPGFREVQIRPQPGSLRHVETVLPHPRGEIRACFDFNNEHCEGRIVLPPETPGVFEWQGKEINLSAGENRVVF